MMDDLITAEQIASMAGITKHTFSAFRKKISAPDPIIEQVRGFHNGKPALYSKQQYQHWLRDNNIHRLIKQARFLDNKLKNPNAIQRKPNKFNTGLMIAFLKGQFDSPTKQAERQIKINRNKHNPAPRHIISVYPDHDFRYE